VGAVSGKEGESEMAGAERLPAAAVARALRRPRGKGLGPQKASCAVPAAGRGRRLQGPASPAVYLQPVSYSRSSSSVTASVLRSAGMEDSPNSRRRSRQSWGRGPGGGGDRCEDRSGPEGAGWQSRPKQSRDLAWGHHATRHPGPQRPRAPSCRAAGRTAARARGAPCARTARAARAARTSEQTARPRTAPPSPRARPRGPRSPAAAAGRRP
jgi:hypothetical protein